MKQTHKVVVIATNEQSRIILNPYNKLTLYNVPQRLAYKDEGRNLYVLSDGGIKDGEWGLNMGNEIVSYKQAINSKEIVKYKIIATTDKSLKYLLKTKDGFSTVESLPSVPESFIKAYIKAYNENNPITEVQLEWNEFVPNDGINLNGGYHKELKTREDNTVIIHQAKLYTREEVINKLKTLAELVEAKGGLDLHNETGIGDSGWDDYEKEIKKYTHPKTYLFNTDKWIEDNL